ncbi:hypothetical protein DEU56DRAFT_313499 [Suillus clintonianus]|uniref:uncharacterized protein n=1 Tax=Suillus clintonianus TaxID=1904413 RepID=UPI001B86E334|nr:uncharacterized protein DEU56DRAFT_313499 [Suillus clintonianus]KAG2155543.1 hypothetical protein DEU56DRAFT_313499 [Suillus clintonianus]
MILRCSSMEAQSSVESVEDQCDIVTYSRQEAHDRQSDSDVPTTSLSASTRCMIIPDLQWKIFQLIHHDDAFMEHSRNKTLLALALTCKSFTGLALDLLWQDLSGLSPLIRCLPSSLWKHVKKKLEFQRIMTIDDWSIFCKYNHRVRSLQTATNTFGTDIWRTLSCPPFSLPLLPNLMSLVWSETTRETFLYMRLFVTPKLMTLNISHQFTFGLSEQSILSSIPMLCPLVSNFGIHGNIEAGDISNALQYWSHLSSVSTGEVSEAAILYLSSLRSLRFLKFILPSTSISVDTQTLLRQSAFCALQQLTIESETMELLNTFLETLSITPEVLSLDITDQTYTTLNLPALISRLPDVCGHSSLQHVQLSIADWSLDHNNTIGVAVFQPLSAFRNLRKLGFEMDPRLELDDDALLELAKAWPLLEELHFNKSRMTHHVSSNTFVSLLQHCPCLVSVGIAVNWSAIDKHGISPDVPYQGFTHRALSHAFFSNSKIRHPTRIAAFISAIAPNMESIEAWDIDIYEEHDDFDKYSSRWYLVQRLIKSFSMVREQGRRMMLNGGEAADEDHRRVAQPAQKTENGEAAAADVGGAAEGSEEDGGSEGDYLPHSDQASSDPEEE